MIKSIAEIADFLRAQANMRAEENDEGGILLRLARELEHDVHSLECDHNEMTERPDDPKHAWQCAKCGYVFGA